MLILFQVCLTLICFSPVFADQQKANGAPKGQRVRSLALHQRFEQSDLPSRREHRNGEAGGEAGQPPTSLL